MYANGLVRSVFESMAWTAEQATKTAESSFQYQRMASYKDFLEYTSKPVKLEDKAITEAEFITEAEYVIKRLIKANLLHTTIDQLVISDVDLSTQTFKLMLKATFVYNDDNSVMHRQGIHIKSKTRRKLSQYATKYILTQKKKFCAKMRAKGFSEIQDDCYSDTSMESYTDRVLKNFAKYASKSTAWLYFAVKDIKAHYDELADKENLTSCMTRGFSLYQKDRAVYPLDGYNYAPDFKLALVSFLSPEEVVKSEEYPFVARAIVSYQSSKPNATGYSKSYGNENATNLIFENIARIDKPIGKRFYAIPIDKAGNSMRETEICCNTIDELDENINRRSESKWYAFTAPFIDTWSNHFQLDDEDNVEFETTPDGIKKVLVQVCEFSDDDDFEDDEDSLYNTPYLAIHYASGIVRQSRRDGNDQRYFMWDDNRQEIQYGDWY